MNVWLWITVCLCQLSADGATGGFVSGDLGARLKPRSKKKKKNVVWICYRSAKGSSPSTSSYIYMCVNSRCNPSGPEEKMEDNVVWMEGFLVSGQHFECAQYPHRAIFIRHYFSLIKRGLVDSKGRSSDKQCKGGNPTTAI